LSGARSVIAPSITASIVGDFLRSYAGLQPSIRLSRFVGVGRISAAWRSRFGVSICAFAPFARLPVSISCALNLLPPFGFTGVGIMP
jgi:hypothetical protein